MGREFRILAAAMSWPDLLAQLDGRAAEFFGGGDELAARASAPGVACRGLSIKARELGGKAYLSEASGLLTGGEDPDLICEIALASGRLVVGCGTDCASGHSYLVAADGDGLLRCFQHRRGAFTRAFEWGEPIPTELDYPLDGDDCTGLRMALRYFGFEPEIREASGNGPFIELQIRPLSESRRSRLGPLGRAVQGHDNWFRIQPQVEIPAMQTELPTEACEPIRGYRRNVGQLVVDRLRSWASAGRPWLLPRAGLSRSSLRPRDTGRWVPGRELS